MLWLRGLRLALRPADLRFVRRAPRRSAVLCRLRWAPGAMLRRPAPGVRSPGPELPARVRALRPPAVRAQEVVRGPGAAVRREAVPAQAGAVRSKAAALRRLRRA